MRRASRLLYVVHARRKAGFTAPDFGALFGVKGSTVSRWEGTGNAKKVHTPGSFFHRAVFLRFAMFASSQLGVNYLHRMRDAVVSQPIELRPTLVLTWLFGRLPPRPDNSWKRYWTRVRRGRSWRDKYSYTRAKTEAEWKVFSALWEDPDQIARQLGMVPEEKRDDGRNEQPGGHGDE